MLGSHDDATMPAAFAQTLVGSLEDTLAATGAGPDAAAKNGEMAGGTPERWALGAVLGQGGMGRVLAATDRAFGREVAVKELLTSASSDAHVRRFVLESLVTGNLEHPGIVPVYERGLRDGRPYYVMRKLEGRTLAQALAQTRTVRERLQLVPHLLRVAQTIAFAHERGVIHRDLKPQNLVLGTHGEVTVIDWGIARIRALDRLGLDVASLPAGDSPAAADQTADGSVLGTPAYMAPEQAGGHIDQIDERTDVFALGALLYHLLCGQPPFEAKLPAARLVKAMEVDCPPLAEVAPGAPPALVQICERAMAKDPDARYRSATQLAEALELALTDALAGKESRALNLLTGAISVLVLAAAGVGGLFTWWSMPSFAALGDGAYLLVAWTAVGALFGILELSTGGRYQLSGLVLAFTGLTFASGVLSTLVGIIHVLEAALEPAALADAERWRTLISQGTYESIGNLVAGTAMAACLLLLWGVASRRTARLARARRVELGRTLGG